MKASLPFCRRNPPVAVLALWLALWGAGPAARGQPIERLLLTPQQRIDLERLRSLRTDPPATGAGGQPALGVAAAAAAPLAVQVPQVAASGAGLPRAPAAQQRVQGWVLRSDGRSTVWVDGVPYYGFDAQGPARGAPGQRPVDLLPEGALRIQRRPAAGATAP